MGRCGISHQYDCHRAAELCRNGSAGENQRGIKLHQRGAGAETEAVLVYHNQYPSPVSPDKPADQPSIPNSASPTAGAAPQPPAEIVVPAGTKIPLTLINSLSTKHSSEGDRVYLQTSFPIIVDGRIVIPRGSYVTGTVTESKRPGKVKGKGEIFLRFDSLTLTNGTTRDFRSRLGGTDASEGQFDRAEGKIKGDGRIGDEVKQADELEKGIYFHQIRATPADKTVLIVARGNNPEGTKPEDPGSLHVYDFKNGVLSHRRKIAPNGGYGFGGRHLDIHPSQPWVYLSVERQNQLIVYKMMPDGDVAPEPLFTKSTLADPARKFRIQSAGPIHVHPNGRFVYLGNRSGLASAAGPGVEDVGGKMVFSGGESNIAVFAIDRQTGEPTAIQYADIRAAHPRTFGLDTGGRLLVAGSLSPSARRARATSLSLEASMCSPRSRKTASTPRLGLAFIA